MTSAAVATNTYQDQASKAIKLSKTMENQLIILTELAGLPSMDLLKSTMITTEMIADRATYP